VIDTLSKSGYHSVTYQIPAFNVHCVELAPTYLMH